MADQTVDPHRVIARLQQQLAEEATKRAQFAALADQLTDELAQLRAGRPEQALYPVEPSPSGSASR